MNENLKANETHFRGINSRVVFEIHESSFQKHQLFYPSVISLSGNAKIVLKIFINHI